MLFFVEKDGVLAELWTGIGLVQSSSHQKAALRAGDLLKLNSYKSDGSSYVLFIFYAAHLLLLLWLPFKGYVIFFLPVWKVDKGRPETTVLCCQGHSSSDRKAPRQVIAVILIAWNHRESSLCWLELISCHFLVVQRSVFRPQLPGDAEVRWSVAASNPAFDRFCVLWLTIRSITVPVVAHCGVHLCNRKSLTPSVQHIECKSQSWPTGDWCRRTPFGNPAIPLFFVS